MYLLGKREKRSQWRGGSRECKGLRKRKEMRKGEGTKVYFKKQEWEGGRRKSQDLSVETAIPSFRDKTWVLERQRHG